MKLLDKEMTKLLHEIGLNCDFEQLTLSRIDCCLDYFPESQKWVDEALRVIRRSPYMKQYKLCTFGKEFSNRKKKNAHSWRICCKTTTLTVYDKTFQLMEEELLEDYDAPMLRFDGCPARAQSSSVELISKWFKTPENQGLIVTK